MANLDTAIILATIAHSGQKDKAGNPYITHPMRVMQQMNCDKTRIVAVLHDIVEDTFVTLDDLRRDGFSEEIVLAVDAITKKDSEKSGDGYQRYMQRVKLNKLARIVKLADLADNMRLERLPVVTERDLKRQAKYERAKAYLQFADAEAA